MLWRNISYEEERGAILNKVIWEGITLETQGLCRSLPHGCQKDMYPRKGHCRCTCPGARVCLQCLRRRQVGSVAGWGRQQRAEEKTR